MHTDLSVLRDGLQAVNKELLVLRQCHEQERAEGSGKQQQAFRHWSFICWADAVYKFKKCGLNTQEAVVLSVLFYTWA